jgi:hypothetical protein
MVADSKSRGEEKRKKHNPIEDCKLYIEGFNLDEYLKDVKGTVKRMSRNSFSKKPLDVGGPEIDAVPGYSNFAAACQVMARLSSREGMSDALGVLDRRVAKNEEKQDDATQDLKKQMAAVRTSLIAVTEIKYRGGVKEVQSKLLERMTQDAISGEVITAKESPADIVEKIAKIVDQYAPDYCALRNLSAQVVLKGAELWPRGNGPRQICGYRKQTKNIIPLIDCRNKMLAHMNERKEEGDIDNKRPLMFEYSPMIRVKNGRLGQYVAGDQNALQDEVGHVAESAIEAMKKMFNKGRILQRFEWNGNGWQAYSDKQPVGVVRRTVYGLMSAIIRTKLGGAYEYLYVHWPYNKPNPLVRGKRWIDAFDAAIKAGEKPSLGEVCELFYRSV